MLKFCDPTFKPFQVITQTQTKKLKQVFYCDISQKHKYKHREAEHKHSSVWRHEAMKLTVPCSTQFIFNIFECDGHTPRMVL